MSAATTPEPRRLCAIADLPDRSARGFAELGIFVVRNGDDVRGWRDACPHYGDTPLAWRRDAYLNADATRIVCAAHGAQFLPATGVCVLGPCLGQSLTPVALTLTDDGAVELDCRADAPTDHGPGHGPDPSGGLVSAGTGAAPTIAANHCISQETQR